MTNYDDPEFIDSNNNLTYEKDNMLYDCNVIEGIEIGYDGCEGEVEDEDEDFDLCNLKDSMCTSFL